MNQLVDGVTDYSAIHEQTGASLTTVRSALSIAKKTGKIKKSVGLSHTGRSDSSLSPSDSTVSEQSVNNSAQSRDKTNRLTTIDDLSARALPFLIG